MYKSAILALAGLTLVACQSTYVKPENREGVELSPSEVMDLHKGNTAVWSSGEGRGYFAEDGSYLWKTTEGKTGQGKWRVSDAGDICVLEPEWWQDEEHCFDIRRDADGNLFSYDHEGKRNKNGKPLLPGNQLN